MQDVKRHPRFPLGVTLLLMLAAGALTLALLLALLPLFVGGEAAVYQTIMVVAGVVLGSAILSLLPLALFSSFGLTAVMMSYFGGAALRFVLCLLACVVFVKGLHLPVATVAVSLVAMYLPLLLVEAALVGRYLWNMSATDSTGRPRPSPSKGALA